MATPTIAEDRRVRYLYGVVRVDRLPMLDSVSGVGGAAVSYVECDGLAAVVAEGTRDDFVPRDAERADTAWLGSAVRAHELVLERCLEAGPVVPMRFATTLRDEGGVLELLRQRHVELAATLDRLLGYREWGVKALGGDPRAVAQHVLAAHDDLRARERELAGRSPGAAYLARKRLDQELSLAGEDLIAERVDAAHRRLTAYAADARLLTSSQPRAERVYLNAAYLVAEADETTFQTEVRELQREHADLDLRYELTGPWPAYNFVGDELRL